VIALALGVEAAFFTVGLGHHAERNVCPAAVAVEAVVASLGAATGLVLRSQRIAALGVDATKWVVTALVDHALPIEPALSHAETWIGAGAAEASHALRVARAGAALVDLLGALIAGVAVQAWLAT
jgi:hypothetical protein